MGSATFFLSTGRSGTQWLNRVLAEEYRDLAHVVHEPLGAHYEPRKLLANDEPSALVLEHFRNIDSFRKGRDYVEVGWPSFGAVPMLARRFGADLKLIHLVRNPVHTALSLVTHNFYTWTRDDDWTRLGQLDPSCAGVAQTGYEERWSSMSRFEKCLFWWTEIHAKILRTLADHPDVPHIRVRFEDLFSDGGQTLERIVTFIGLPWRHELRDHLSKKFDRHSDVTTELIDGRLALQHPLCVEIATQFGYDLDTVVNDELTERYSAVKATAEAPRWEAPSPAGGSPGKTSLPIKFRPTDDDEVRARLTRIAESVEPIQGWLSHHSGAQLYRHARFKVQSPTIVELGSWKGRSTCWLASAIKDRGEGRVFAVDTWRGTEGEKEHHRLLAGYGPDTLYEEFLENMRQRELIGHVTPIRSDTIAAARSWDGSRIGLLFMDADQEYMAVRRDFEFWSPYVEIGGYIVFDDVPSWRGPARLVQELPRWYRYDGWANNSWYVRKVGPE